MQAGTCLRIGSKFRCIRSTPTDRQLMSENDFECFASTGVNTPGTMFPDSGPVDIRFSRNRLPASLALRAPPSGLPVIHLQPYEPLL
jgi:hypothetical protein